MVCATFVDEIYRGRILTPGSPGWMWHVGSYGNAILSRTVIRYQIGITKTFLVRTSEYERQSILLVYGKSVPALLSKPHLNTFPVPKPRLSLKKNMEMNEIWQSIASQRRNKHTIKRACNIF